MKRQFANIQAMRGVAALMVCLVHSVAMPVSVGMDYAVPFVGAVGPAGVDLFFVISGFIIATVAADAGSKSSDRGRFTTARDFALKRMARIYPIYWIAFILAVLVSPYIALAPVSVPQKPLWRLFLLIDTNNSKIMAAWTLVFELYFYLVIGVLLLLAPRHIFRGILVWALATIGLIAYFQVTRNPLRFEVPFSPLLIEFMLGTLIAYAAQRRIWLFPLGAIITGVLLFAIGAYANHNFGNWDPSHRTIAFGPASALIIYGVIAYEMQYSWTFIRPWQRLGDASYSLYIWHQPLFFSMLAISLWLGLFQLVPGIALVPIWILMVLGWSFLSFHCIENPLRKWIEGIIAGRTGKAERAGTSFRSGAPSPATAYGLVAMAGCLVAFMTLGGYAYSMRGASASAPADATQIERAMAEHHADLGRAAGILGMLPDGALRGHLDIAEKSMPQTILLQGWAADTSGQGRSLRLMTYQCGRYLGSPPLRIGRPDVAAALGIAGDQYGFSEILAMPPGCDGKLIDILIVTEDRRFAIFSRAIP